MTTESDDRDAKARRWWQYIGPWPLRPWVVSLSVGAGVFIVATASWREGFVNDPVRTLAEGLSLVGVAALVVGLTTTVATRVVSRRFLHRLVPYLVILTVSAALASVGMFITELAFGISSQEPLLDLIQRTLRLTIVMALVLAIAGIAEDRLRRQTRLAEESLSELDRQHSLMLIREEQSRRQFAMLLHDQVQAGLMTACLELKMATTDETLVNRERIDAVITRIDHIRGLELHQAARALSPDLSNLGLHGALRDLMRIYEPAVRASIHVAPEVTQMSPPLPTQVLLACYRIVEQGVLNSVVHGQATECVITVTVPSNATVSIEVSDNGTGVDQTDNARGFGSAVLDSWCRVLGGSWELDYPPGGGARLIATLSLESGAEFDLTGADVSLQ
jgi:signal transduction histidine kinase